MAYAVDARIREQHAAITAKQQGESDGNDWLHSKAAQRMSLARPEVAHTREVISKFGGTIKVGTIVAIPPQHWEGPSRNPFSSDSFRGRSAPSHVIINTGVAGYSGHRPHAAGWETPYRESSALRKTARPP